MSSSTKAAMSDNCYTTSALAPMAGERAARETDPIQDIHSLS